MQKIDIKSKYLFGRFTSVMQFEFIERQDKEWAEQFARDLTISPQRQGVVIDCIEWKFNELTSINKRRAITEE